jgi:hypothetical protein
MAAIAQNDPAAKARIKDFISKNASKIAPPQ